MITSTLCFIPQLQYMIFIYIVRRRPSSTGHHELNQILVRLMLKWHNGTDILAEVKVQTPFSF